MLALVLFLVFQSERDSKEPLPASNPSAAQQAEGAINFFAVR
jgi:hypothetical protein